MKDSIILEGKIYISARRAAKIINYAQDYIGQLCRAGKLDSKMVGRSWFVTEESLIAHRESAIDATEVRVAGILRAQEVEIKQAIRNSDIQKKITQPFVSPGASPFSYEVETKSLLPELNKKVPKTFSLPKNVASVAPRMMLKAPTHALSFSGSVHPVFATVVIVLIATAGFLFTMSLAPQGSHVARNEASVGSAISGVVTRLMQSLGVSPRTTSPVAISGSSGDAVENTSNFNGIGITPSVHPDADELEKAKIRNSFSDEVIIEPDQSGTAGVIKPVFKKTDSKDFVYVLVPVKEEKK